MSEPVTDFADLGKKAIQEFGDLHAAILKGANAIVIDAMIEAGEKPWEFMPWEGQRMLISAAENGDCETCECLLNRGVELFPADSEHRFLLPGLAIANENIDLLAAVLRAGFDPHELDEVGISLLHYSVQAFSAKSIRFLVGAGADVNIRSRTWVLPSAMLANAFDDFTDQDKARDTFQAMLELGFDFDVSVRGRSLISHIQSGIFSQAFSDAERIVLAARLSADVLVNEARRRGPGL